MGCQTMLKVDSLSLAYGGNTVLKNINFELEKGQHACLIGPSGSGKSSLLRSIAGFEMPQSGAIYLRNQLAYSSEINVPPEQRRVGMLFQDLALFPHLTVKENIAFGMVGRNKNDVSKTVVELLDLVGLSDFSGRYSHQLSGGQQQRVALARALAPEPGLLLLDEPFSSLDNELRSELVKDVYGILSEKEITTLMVTHDQVEAFSVADKLGVLVAGELAQWGSPFALYNEPVSKAVADFVGFGSYISATLVEKNTLRTALGTVHCTQANNAKVGEKLKILLRPENMQLNDNSPIKAKVLERLYRGADSLLTLSLNNGETFFINSPNGDSLSIGQIVGVEQLVKTVVAFN